VQSKNSSSGKQRNTVTFPVNNEPINVILSLKISSEFLEPEQISQLLNLIPTRSHRKGEIKSPSSIPKANGIWILATDHLKEEHDLNTHIQWLAGQFIHKKKELELLIEKSHKITMICRFGVAHWNTSFICTAESIALIASLGVPMVFDVYDDQWED